jgi:NADP-dependent 3-hydroxy acid dehydrogenase YdfG
MNVKVMGYLRKIRELAPHMAAQGCGRIINISGLAALNTGSTIGSIRNVGVAALTKNLADELAPSGTRRSPCGASDGSRDRTRSASRRSQELVRHDLLLPAARKSGR